ncbi:hypothetical protein H4582DRAFT_2083108 [Lactarius indigo]|nr:hypothetical protein H4582DRAFT_2083108 [Lactarius indigo]
MSLFKPHYMQHNSTNITSFYNTLPHTSTNITMQSDHLSGSSAGESEVSRPSIHALGDRFSITSQDARILKGYVEEFQNADTEIRKTILEKAMGELYTLRPPNSTFNKKMAKMKIRTWFYNHYSRPHRQLIKFTRKWSARNAFYHENKEEIMELAQSMSGGIPGSQAFLGALQDATTSLWKKLSIEEQEPYAEIAKEWSEDRPPRDIQAKMAQAKFRSRIVRDFQTQLFKTCGMRSIVLVAYADTDGRPRAAMDDWNKVLDDGMSFSDFCPDWRNASIWQEWMKYCRKCFVPENDQGAHSGSSKVLRTKVKIVIDTDGEPDIPSVTPEDGYSAKTIQTVLRDYCNSHIRYVSRRKNATIPWSKLSSDPPTWIEEECYPLGFLWADPSKLRLVQVFQLLDHWRQRQREGLIPLIWNPSCELLANVDHPVQHIRNPKRTCRRSSKFNEPESDNQSEEEDFAKEIQALHSPSVTPPLPPSPSPSPFRRHKEIEQTSIPDVGESPHPPPSSISRPKSFQAHHRIQRGTPIRPATHFNSDPPELEQEPVKRVVKITHKARNADTGRGSGGLDPTYLQRDH